MKGSTMSQENPQSLPSSLPATNQSGHSPQENLSESPHLPVNESDAGRELSQWSNDVPAYVTNLPTVTEDDVIRLSTLMAKSDRKSKNCVGATLAVAGFAIDFGPVGEADDGELIEGVRGHILLDDGTSVFTTSRGVLKALKMAAQTYRAGPWIPPVLIDIIAVPGKGGEALIGILRGRAKTPAKKK